MILDAKDIGKMLIIKIDVFESILVFGVASDLFSND